MKLTPRLWLGVGVSVLAAGPALAASTVDQPTVPALAQLQVAQGGEGGEGGEGGVSAADAAKDPVAYLTALDVIAAHYLAGLDAYKAGDATAAGEMFAHPISEIYVDLEPVFAARSVKPFMDPMSKASELALSKAPQAEVAKAAETVLKALNSAAEMAPGNAVAPAVQGKVIVGMLRRAAMQYAPAAQSEEAYLDGYGLYKAAAARAEDSLPAIAAKNADAGAAIQDALATLAKAYPTAKRPARLDQDAGALLAAASKAELAVSRLN